jgi:hypothetical protein
MDNSERRGRGQQILRAYRGIHPDYWNENEPDDQAVTDLLADLMHYCKQQGIDFRKCVAMAEVHFEEER